ncbi:uncharacterized protein LOC102713884 [Oryza brachyantha]|uniref:FAR1 domain-containing protein n=1 Tax=Oryza brachyantha TaxID=4533 RepID=J3LM46_ORYBR|nr:uncharacterized protein LOC102713884 [Oryza brachyantha]
MEGVVTSTVSEPKQDNEQRDSSAEFPRALTDMETSAMHDPEAQNLIGHEADTELTPYEGMEFESEDAARDFYSKYARHAGFRIRISRYTRSRRDNSIISRRIVCSKEGFHETRDCENLHVDQKQQARVGTRVGCKAMLMIKKFGPDKWVVTKFIKNHNHGPVPPRKLHAGEHDSDLKENPHSIEAVPIDEPVEGMEFESEEAAKLFYINYARVNGFRARISRYCRSRRDNSIISRQIVCSKEGFREVRARKDITDEGKTSKRPRMITRVGCKAMIVVKKMNSGKWMVSKFEKEHNHSLLSSRAVPITSTSGKVVDIAATSTDPNEVKVEGYKVGVQCNSTDSLTVLYNHLCQEAIKFAKEGSVTEEIYHVAMNALKEAAKKVSEVKRSHPLMSQGGYAINKSKHEVMRTEIVSALQCSNEDNQKKMTPQLELFQEPSSSLVLIPTNSLTHSSSNCADNIPLSCDLTIKAGEVRHVSESSYLAKDSSQKSQNSTCNQAFQGKDGKFHGPEETAVAIPAIPLTLYMPIMKNPPRDSADGPYRLLTAPIEAVPISYRPAEPIQHPQRSFSNLRTLPGFLPKSNKRGKGPNSLVHATALACGARVVPPMEAASLIKVIESKIRSGGATIAILPSSSLTPLIPEVASMSSSSEDDEENDHSEPLMESIEHNCHDQSSEEMKLQADPSELETETENCSAQPENENDDPTRF